MIFTLIFITMIIKMLFS